MLCHRLLILILGEFCAHEGLVFFSPVSAVQCDSVCLVCGIIIVGK